MNLSFLEVKSFCFCVSLKTGSKIIGFVSLVGSMVIFCVSTYYLVYIMHFASNETEELVLTSIDLVVQIIQAVSSFVLLLGLYQEKAALIPWWMVSTVVVAILNILLLPSFASWLIVVENNYNELILSCLLLVDDIYGLIVVYSYYRTLTPNLSYPM